MLNAHTPQPVPSPQPLRSLGGITSCGRLRMPCRGSEISNEITRIGLLDTKQGHASHRTATSGFRV